MRKIHLVVLTVVLSIFGMLPVIADKGFISFNPQAQIFEPKQRAIICWNGEEEILFLSTDLKASKKSKILEVIPLPSKPTIKKAHEETLIKMTGLINDELEARRITMEEYSRRLATSPGDHESGAGGGFTEARTISPGGELAFHEKIGSHDVSVAQVLRPGAFVEWAQSYMELHGGEFVSVPDKMKQIIEEYISNGFGWFVFDIVDLDENPKTNEAIQYRFEARSLYYPLRITSTGSGYSRIDLVVISPHLFSEFSGIDRREVSTLYEPMRLSVSTLGQINSDLADLFTVHTSLLLRTWRLEGLLSDFSGDLIARGTKDYSDPWADSDPHRIIRNLSVKPADSEVGESVRSNWKPLVVRRATEGLWHQVAELLDAGVDLQERYYDNVSLQEWTVGDHLLMMCSKNGPVDIAEQLLDKGVSHEKQHIPPILAVAAENGNTAVAELLLKKGAGVDGQLLSLIHI